MDKNQNSFDKKSFEDFMVLHRQAVERTKNLHHDEFLIIEILQKIDQNKGYRYLKFTSLFKYATLGLNLTRDRAYVFIQVARKASGISKLQEALKNGSMRVSTAKKISSVVSKGNVVQWLELAKNLSQRSLERAVVRENPKAAVEEGTRFVSEKVLELKAAIEESTETLLKRVQDVISQAQGKSATYDETLREMAQVYLERHDPVRKARRAMARTVRGKEHPARVEGPGQKSREINAKSLESNNTSASVDSNPTKGLPSQRAVTNYKSRDLQKRQPIPSILKHQVYSRDLGQCQAPDCDGSRWVDLHHINPVSKGGENILENLVTLCRAHHQMEHEIH